MIHWLMVKLLFLELLFLYALVGTLLGALVFFKKSWLAWTVAILAFAGLVWFGHSPWRAEPDVRSIVVIAVLIVLLLVSFKFHAWLGEFGWRFNHGADPRPADVWRHFLHPGWVAAFIVMTVVFATVDSSILRRVKANIQARERDAVPLFVRMGEVTEFGHIIDVSRKINYGTWNMDVRWWVEIPDNDDVYYCDWDSGYSGFSKGDGVQFIHTKPGDLDAGVYGYLVERQGKEQGHYAIVEGADTSDF